MTADPDWVRRTDHVLLPDLGRVVSTLFLPGQEPGSPGSSRSSGVLDRVLALSDEEVENELLRLESTFGHRHRHLRETWEANYELIRLRLTEREAITGPRTALVGAFFTQEYAIQGAAILNPSMIAHPDQSGLPAGTIRFVMSMRSVGEGHLSSVELRTGVIDAEDVITFDPPPEVAVLPTPRPTRYSRVALAHQLQNGEEHASAEEEADAGLVLAALPDEFTDADLGRAVELLHAQSVTRESAWRAAERFQRLAASTYTVVFPEDSDLQERVLMPRAPRESHGIEDVRLVRLAAVDGHIEHLGTYTAYDGHRIAVHMLQTTDFRTFSVAPLSGPGARNKGLALFPRPIGGRYLALSRADRENNAITTSNDLLHWDRPVRIQVPERPWEIIQLGNCGPPIETEHGWLVLTHGVGPMRGYSISAVLLDLEDPTVVLGRLTEPILTPQESERSGYVPNVVYSCGAMVHGRTLVLPYGCSDAQIRIALVDLDALLGALRATDRSVVQRAAEVQA